MVDVFCTERVLMQTYYETEHMFVAYNKYPVVPGHTLIIPKRHVESPTELTDEEYADMFKAMGKVMPVLLEMYSTDKSYDLIMQVGHYSGMTIHHIHLHVTPRNKDDGYQVDTAQMYEKIKANDSEDILTLDSKVQIEVEKLRKIFEYKPRSK